MLNTSTTVWSKHRTKQNETKKKRHDPRTSRSPVPNGRPRKRNHGEEEIALAEVVPSLGEEELEEEEEEEEVVVEDAVAEAGAAVGAAAGADEDGAVVASPGVVVAAADAAGAAVAGGAAAAGADEAESFVLAAFAPLADVVDGDD